MSNTEAQRDWNRQPNNFFDLPLHKRMLYTQAYNELEKEHPNVVLPQDLILERIQQIVNRNSPYPESIWIDSAGLSNAEARGYENYYLRPPSETEEFGPSDGKSVQYFRRVAVLREAAALICRYCAESDKYGVAELNTAKEDGPTNLYSHRKYSGVWCDAQRIWEAIAKDLLSKEVSSA